MLYNLNGEVTGYRQPLEDSEIENTWESTNSVAPNSIFSSYPSVLGSTGLGIVFTSISGTSSPKITIQYDLNDFADLDALKLWRWANDIDIKTISVNYNFNSYPNPLLTVPFSLSINENKWHDYLDDEIPSFHTAMDKVSSGNRDGYWLNNHYGPYKVTFQGNDSTGGGAAVGQKKKLTFRLE